MTATKALASTMASILSTTLPEFTIEWDNSSLCGNLTGNSSDCVNNSTGIAKGPTEYPATVLGFTAAMAFVFAILGSLGNLLTLLAVPNCKKLRTSSTAFVLNLALAELLFCVVILPLSGMQYLHLQYNDGLSMFGDKACVFFATTRYTIVQAELQTILAIAFTRTLAVTVPSVYGHINNKKATTIYIIAIWIWSFGIRVPIATGAFGNYSFNSVTMECDVSQGAGLARLIYNLIEIMIPVPLILIFYIIIFIQVRRSSTRVEKQAQMSRRPTLASVPSVTSETSNSSSSYTGERRGSAGETSIEGRKPSTGGRKASLRPALLRLTSRRSSNSLLNNRRDTRVARTIFVIFVMVLTCSVPVAFEHIKAGIIGFVPNPSKFLLLHVLYWSQFCLNLFVYVIMNKQYRDAYVDFLSKYIPGLGAHRGKRFFWENNSSTTKEDKGYSTGSLLRRKGSRKDSRKDSFDDNSTCKPQTLPRANKQLSAINESQGPSSN